MGYRSTVIIAIDKKVFTSAVLIEDTLPQVLKEEPYESNEKGMYWQLESVKWYDSYEDVAEVIRFLDALETEEYAFVRIGENTDDIVLEGSPYEFDINCYTRVETPFN
jgi:hypothetical protein